MKPLPYTLFILLMVAGNCAGLYKLFTDKQVMLEQFPRLTESAYAVFRLLPVLNLIALAGLWYFRYWGAGLAVAGGLLIIGFDIYYGIRYHLYAAIPSMLLLLFFIFLYRNHFK